MSLSKVKTRDYPITDPKRGINYVKTVTNTSYEVRNEDKGWLLVMSSGSNMLVLVPQLSVPVGSQIDFFRRGAGTVTFSPQAGVTIRAEGSILATDNTAATLIKIADTEYLLVGKLTS